MIGALIPVILMHISTHTSFIVVAAIVSITMICHFWGWIKASWKLAVATGGIVALSCVNAKSITVAQGIAYRRVQDVILGCLLLITLSIVITCLVKSKLTKSILLVFTPK